MSNLDLDFKVVFSGCEAASIEAFRKAEENKEWVIGYWYEPQYFNAEVAMQRVALPAVRGRAARTTRRRSPATTRRRS